MLHSFIKLVYSCLDKTGTDDQLVFLQVVVVSSGTNDWHTVPPLYTLSQWLSQAVGFLKQVSTNHWQAPVHCQLYTPPRALVLDQSTPLSQTGKQQRLDLRFDVSQGRPLTKAVTIPFCRQSYGSLKL